MNEAATAAIDPASAPAAWLGLKGKTALITGGAKGIGRAIAQRFLELGAGVIVIDRTANTAAIIEEIRERIPKAAPARCFVVDVRRRGALEEVRASLERAGTTLDIVIPNAGINVRLPALEIRPDQVQDIIDTNLAAVIATLQIFVPMIVGRPEPRVVVTSSVSAIHGMLLRATYAATKAGLSGLVRGLALEWGAQGILVNAVGPGIIHTALIESYMAQNPDKVRAAMEHTPLHRLGTPEEVADVVVFLASRAARFMTGQTVYVDGGLSAGSHWW